MTTPRRRRRRRRQQNDEDRRVTKEEDDPEFEDAWGGSTEDRSTYNLGDGCRRVPARGSYD